VQFELALVTLSNFASTISNDQEEVDIALVGAGIGGLCAGAILNSLYNKKVGIYEKSLSHWRMRSRV